MFVAVVSHCIIIGVTFHRNIKHKYSSMLGNTSPVYPDIVDRDAADAYSEWKATINRHIKMLGDKAPTAPRPANVTTNEHWRECLKRAASKEFQEISKINTDNRRNLKYLSLQGRTPYPRRRYEDVDPETDPVGRSVFEVWRDAHMKEGKWVDDEAEQDYLRYNVGDDTWHRPRWTYNS